MDTNNVNLVDSETSKNTLNPKLIWDNHTFMVFLDECINEDKKGNRQECSISYDSMRKIIIVSTERWEEKIKGDKDYAKFMDKKLEIYD
uniref:Uncharacterized protein n=1 Tax=Lactuca sativa TaxID=4236 RepID=A0A9R1VH80_LACSA|nr:hypothetical protein LSAT_V11C500253690 [Lactuca sativa]